jgi:methyl-accepting chemotaxis protein
MPVAEAQKRAMDSVRNMRYGENGYFIILNSHPTILMHAIHAELNGKDVSEYKDSNGIYLYRDIAELIKRDGQGFTVAVVPKPGTTGLSPKVAYSVIYQPWDWILATGLYVDDIDAAFRSTLCPRNEKADRAGVPFHACPQLNKKRSFDRAAGTSEAGPRAASYVGH